MQPIAKLKQDKLKLYAFIIFICITVVSVQKFYPEDYNNISNLDTNNKFKIFSFTIDDTNTIKTAFFAKDPYNDFLKLNKTSKILYASSASFVSTLDKKNNIPVGFCAEKGEIINKMPHQDMDGIVVISNNHPKMSSVEIIDLDKVNGKCETYNCESHFLHNNIRNDPSLAFSFIDAIESQNISSFQTHLVYTKYKSDNENFEKLHNGNNDRSRRFLAIGKKDGKLHHIIVDNIEDNYLMASAKNSLEYLRQKQYSVDFMVNLDTGSKDIIHAYDGENLINLRPNPLTSSAKIENASSLLVYYTEI